MYPETLSALLAAIYRRRLTVFLVLAGSLGGGLYYQAHVPPTWLASAVVYVPREMPRLSLNNEGANLPSGPPLPDGTEATRMAMVGLLNSGAVHRRVMANNPDLPAPLIRKSIKGDIDQAQQLNVYALNEDKELAVRLANEFVRAFREKLREMVEDVVRRNLTTFRKASEQAWRDYDQAVQDRLAFLDTIASVDMEAEVAQLIGLRSTLRNSLADIDVQRARIQAEREATRRVLEGRPEFRESRRSLSRNPEYVEAVRSAAEARVQLAMARLTYKDDHPQVKTLLARLQSLEEQAGAAAEKAMVESGVALSVDPELERLSRQLVDLDVSEAALDPRRQALEARLTEVDARLAQVPFDRAELERLDREVASRKHYAETVDQRIRELEIQLARGLDPTYTDEDRLARPDMANQLPTTAGLMLFCGLAGLFTGVTLAIGLEVLRRLRLRYPY